MGYGQWMDVTPGALLAATTTTPAEHHEAQQYDVAQHLWGFGGLHGGLALALATAAIARQAPDARLRSVTGRLHRPIRERFAVTVGDVRRGRTLTSGLAGLVVDGTTHLDAAATFASNAVASAAVVSPPMPTAPPPGECPEFRPPAELVPFARHTEIRPVGANRPFAGGDEPELVAWLRLVEDDLPPDPLRIVVLLDSLAPSYAAVLSTPVLVPTVELTVRPTDALPRARSPWILVRARTRAASVDGWVDEELDAWTPDGAHVASGQQLRVVVGA
jgi:hypothetical protein